MLLRQDDNVSAHVQVNWQVENLFHAHYTSNLLEEELRKIREEDYPWRAKYQEQFGNKKE
jgi:hypothetical protein